MHKVVERSSAQAKVGATQDGLRPKLTIAVASGKGGVGKTVSVVNLGLALQKLGLQSLILDADLGLSNVDILLGLQAQHNLGDVLEGRVAAEDIVLHGPLGMRVIPSGSGIARLSNLSYVERLQILDQLGRIKEPMDCLLIDTGAGISPNVLHFNSLAQFNVVVTTPEPHAMTDAYAFIKVMQEQYGKRPFHLLVTQVKSADEGRQVYQRIAEVGTRFIQADVRFLGAVPFDPVLQKAIAFRQAASEASTHTLSGQEYNRIARETFQPLALSAMAHKTSFWEGFVRSEAPSNKGLESRLF